MESILGVPMTVLVWGAGGLFGLGIAALAVIALRNRLLFALAARNIPRRRAQSALITLGLALATVIVTTALNTGDTMSYTIRSLVAGTIGRADELIVKPRRDPRRSGFDAAQAVANGTFLTGSLDLFDQGEYERLRDALAGNEQIAGLAPALVDEVVVVNLTTQELQAQVRLYALPADYPPIFGRLETPDRKPVALADVPDDGIILNADAALATGAEVGHALRVYYKERPLDVTVAAIVRTGELGGVQATLVMPLDDLQRLAEQPRQINQILVANRGSAATSVRLSQDVSRAIRPLLVDDATVRQAFVLLRTEIARSQLAAALPNLDEPTRRQVETLLAELDKPAPSPAFAALVADPDLERRVAAIAGRGGVQRGPGGPGGAGGSGIGLLSQPGSLRLIEVKRLSQELADRWGAALTSVFVVLGLFSIATGVMLTVLIFVLLAAERRSEMGVMRALGAKRRHLILMFLYEGLLYDLVAAGVGLLIGTAVGVGLVMMSGSVLQGFGIQIEPHVEPRSLVLAYCLGAVVTMLSIAVSAWNASRLTVVAAIKNLPEPPKAPRRARTVLLGPATIVAGLGLGWWGLRSSIALPMGGGVVLTALGLAMVARPLLARLGLSERANDRLRYSLAGAILLLYWLVPNEWLRATGLRPLPRSMDLFFVAGLSLVLGAIWLLVSNLELLSRAARAAGTHARGGALLVRTGLAFPVHHRFRTGMTVAMFGLVIFGMVVASVLLTGTHRAYSDPEAMAGGFDMKLDLSPPEVTDVRPLLVDLPTVKAEDFAAIGTIGGSTVEAIQVGDGARSWRQINVNLLDDAFIGSVRTTFTAHAPGYATDAAVWRALAEGPGLAVIAGPAVRPRQSDPLPNAFFQLDGVVKEDRAMSPLGVWLRDPRGGPAVKVTVIGIMDPRATFGAGIYTSQATFGTAGADEPSAGASVASAGMPSPQRSTAYLRVQSGTSAAEKTLGLNLGLQERGLRASEIGEDVRRILGLRMLLNDLLQAFIGVGLLAGIAGLGVISTRAVVERRQQIGVMRALGFTRRAVQGSFLIEASLIALLGILVGTLLGLGLSYRLVEFLGREFPEIVFAVPWQQIGGIALFAYVASMLTTLAPAWQAGRISPAEALRYE